MGHQIALCAALAEFIQTYLPERVAKGKLNQEAAKKAHANVCFTTNLEEAASNADFVIEAVVERLDVKRKLFADFDQIVPANTVLSTNSSTFVSSKLADATGWSAQICNMHFFNPALIMTLVEVVQGTHTSEETIQVTMDLCTKQGKKGNLYV